MNRTTSLLRSLLPVLDKKGSTKLSRESTLHLLQAIIGVLVVVGVLTPDQVDADAVNAHGWQVQEGLVGIWVVFQGLASNLKRHREADDDT